MGRKVLLACGILSALLYAAMSVLVPMLDDGYSSFSQAVSELSAIGAPTAGAWIPLGLAYSLLAVAFGWGVWLSAARPRPLRVAGAALLAQGVFGLFWPPMHMRGGEFTLTDTLHIVWTIVTVVLMAVAIGFGAAAFGPRFRRYSVITLVVLVGFGALTALHAPNLDANLPTPWMGVWERINIGAFLVWNVVLAVALFRRPAPPDSGVLKSLAQRPLLSYFALTFLLSWSGVLLVIGGAGALPGATADTQRLLPWAVLVMLVGPTVSGVLMTAVVHGRADFGGLVMRLRPSRALVGWYAIAALTPVVLAMVTLLALLPLSPVFLPGIFAAEDKASLLQLAVVVGLSAGIFEEIGWTGFATPMLRRRRSVLASGLILGFVWGGWHYLVALWASGDPSARFSLAIFLPQLLFYVAVLPVFRVLMVWVHDQSGSLLAAMLMHASLTGGLLFLSMPAAIPSWALVTWYVVLGSALWAVVAAVGVTRQSTDSSAPRRRRLAA